MPSEVIRQFSYDPAAKTLQVTFTSGEVYVYEGFPPEAADAFRRAFSKGRWFAREIRPRYPGRRVSRDPDFWRPEPQG
jgi:hypothetical protein